MAWMILLAVVTFPVDSPAGDRVTFSFFSRGWPPFEMLVEDRPEGAAVDLFKALMPPDVEAVMELVPAPRNKLREQTGPVYARLESRQWIKDPGSFLWSDPVVAVDTVLYSSKDHPREYDGEDSLYGLTVGCIKGFIYPAVEHVFASGRAVRYDVNDDLILLRMLKAGRVDAALFDDISVRWILKKTGEMDCDDFYVARNPVSSENLRFFFNRNPEWRKRLPEINARIRQKRSDGDIEAIMSRYR